MRYTTVVWGPDFYDNDNIIVTLQEKILELKTQGIETEMILSEDNLTARRSWPDLASAEVWVDFVKGIGAVTATVDPE
jgi:hypothetical protein